MFFLIYTEKVQYVRKNHQTQEFEKNVNNLYKNSVKCVQKLFLMYKKYLEHALNFLNIKTSKLKNIDHVKNVNNVF